MEKHSLKAYCIYNEGSKLLWFKHSFQNSLSSIATTTLKLRRSIDLMHTTIWYCATLGFS